MLPIGTAISPVYPPGPSSASARIRRSHRQPRPTSAGAIVSLGPHPPGPPLGSPVMPELRIGSTSGPILLADEPDDLLIPGDNAAILPLLPDAAFDLIYVDPPFNTGRTQSRHTLAVTADEG